MDEEQAPPPSLAMSFVAAAMFAILAHLAIGGVVELTDALRPGAALDVVNLTACQLLVHLGLIFLIARIYAREVPLRQMLGLRRVSPVVLLFVVVLGIGAEMPIAYIEQAWSSRFPLSEAQEADIARVLTADTRTAKIVLGACLAVLWPLGQELFHRGALFGRLRAGQDARTTTFAIAAFFALSTVATPRGLPSAAALGLGLAALRAGTGSTWASLAAHVAFMGSAVIRLFRGPTDEALTVRHAAIGAAVATIAAALLASRLVRDDVALGARRRDGALERGTDA